MNETIQYYQSNSVAEQLMQQQFDYWQKPGIFEDSIPFINSIGLPIYILSNIDTQDLKSAANPISIERAWELITSSRGVQIWLGGTSIDYQKGQEYLTNEGVSGEVRVVNEFVNIRLTWKKNEWTKPSTL